MRTLFPPLSAVREFAFEAQDGHRVYVEECGNQTGTPIVFLHGGPGSGCNVEHRRFFDPSYYRIVLFDQRGSGRSTPLGETGANSTDLLLNDMEMIRTRLGIERWALFGGSWGATLALRYAVSLPGRVSAILLRGTFLGRARDIDWFFGPNGVARIFPDAYADLVQDLAMTELEDIPAAYHRRVHGADQRQAFEAAQRWQVWGDRVTTWTLPSSDSTAVTAGDRERLLAKVRIETHYAVNRYFLDHEPLLDSLGRLPEVPMSIVHGRRDLVCPCEAAWSVHRAVHGSRLVLLPGAGHLLSEPTMIDALVAETDRIKSVLG